MILIEQLKPILLLHIFLMACSGAEWQHCKQSFVNQSSSGFKGQASWQAQADGSSVGSTEAGTVGRARLSCRFSWKEPVTEAVLDFGGAYTSFAAAPSKEPGAGLLVEVVAAGKTSCSVSGLRVTAEDWVAIGHVRYRVRFDKPATNANVVISLIDRSQRDALRVDLKPLGLKPSLDAGARECPPSPETH